MRARLYPWQEILGKGFMTEAVIAVLDFLLNKVGFKEIKATYVSLNPASGKSWKRQECSM